MSDSSKPKDDHQVVFMLAPGGQEPSDVPMLVVGVSEAAWEYMKDMKTHNFDLTPIGLPFKFVLFGCKDRKHALSIYEQMAAEASIPTYWQEEDFGFDPKSQQQRRQAEDRKRR